MEEAPHRSYLASVERHVGRLSTSNAERWIDTLAPSAPRVDGERTERLLIDLAQRWDREPWTVEPRDDIGQIRPHYPTLMRLPEYGPLVPMGPHNSLTFRPGAGGAAAFLKAQLLYADQVLLTDPIPELGNQVNLLGLAAWLHFLAECRALVADGSIGFISFCPEPALESQPENRKGEPHIDWVNGEFTQVSGVKFLSQYLSQIAAVRSSGLDVDYSLPPWVAHLAAPPADLISEDVLPFRRLQTLGSLPGLGLAPVEAAQLAEIRHSQLFVDVRSGIGRGLARIAAVSSPAGPEGSALSRGILLEETKPSLQRLASFTRRNQIQGATVSGLQRIVLGGASGVASSLAAAGPSKLWAAAVGAAVGGAGGISWTYLADRDRVRMGEAAGTLRDAIAAGDDWYVPTKGIGWPQDRLIEAQHRYLEEARRLGDRSRIRPQDVLEK